LDSEDVAGFDVAMNDLLRVRGGQAVGYCGSNFGGFAPGESFAAEALTQGLAFEQFRYGVASTVAQADIVEDQNVRMSQRRHGFGLVFETDQGGGIIGEMLGEDFDGDVATQPGVPRTIYLAHTARTDGRKDLVGSQTSPSSKGHGR
jgi:hypothetical protein